MDEKRSVVGIALRSYNQGFPKYTSGLFMRCFHMSFGRLSDDLPLDAPP